MKNLLCCLMSSAALATLSAVAAAATDVWVQQRLSLDFGNQSAD